MGQSFDSVGCLGISGASQAFLQRICAALGSQLVILDDIASTSMLRRSALPHALIGLLVGKSATASHLQDLEAISSDLFVLKPEGNTRDDELALVRAIATARGQRCKRLAKAHTEAAGSLSSLRGLFDESQRSFAELDSYLQRHALLRPRTTFAIAAGQESVLLTSETAPLLQPLPFDAYGLAIIRLSLAASLSAGTILEVELMLGQDVAQNWLIQGPLPAQTIKLALNRASTEQYREASLRIRAGGTDPSLRLALSAERIGPRWAARLGTADLSRALALGTSFAPPGIAIPKVGGNPPPGIKASNLHIVVDDWNDVTFSHEPLLHEWQVAVAEDGFLQAHPLVGKPALIRLQKVDLTGFRRIRAEIRLSHASAPQVGFAIALLEKQSMRKLRLRDKDLSWARTTSGWFALNGENSGLAFLDLSPQGPVDIALVTSCLGKKADFAWARWGSIVLER